MALFVMALICSWKLGLGQDRTKADYQYFTPGDTTTLICNTKADTIDWNGPAYSDNFDNQYNIANPYGDVSSYKTSSYSSNITPNKAVPHGNRLQLHKFSLIVQNTTEQDEGLYCCDVYYHTENFRRCILLIKKQPPSGLMLCNAINGSTVKYIQNRPVEIKCTENTGYPPSDLSLLRDNTYIRNGTGQISFEMTPTKENINSTVQCVSRNTYWNRTSFIKVIIDVRYKPEVKFENSTHLEVKEGSRGVVISCSAFGNPQVNKMRMLKEDTEINSVTGYRIRYQFESIDRKDTGKYVCMAKNEVGRRNATMRVVVLYPPDVYVYYLSNSNRLRCVPKGNPDNYTFGLWEHRSFLGERIRFLNPRNQELVFNETTYQDSGVYVCNVTNGIEDQAGNNFQHGFVSYFARSPPIELTGNNHVQNGTIGKQGQIQFDFVSFFLITCQSLTPMNHPLDSILTTHVITNRKSVIKFYNVPVTVNSSRITFIFQNVQQKDFQLYRITVCNQYGKHSYEVDFRQVSDKKEVVHLPTVIIISVVGALIVIIMAFLLFFAIRRRRMQPG